MATNRYTVDSLINEVRSLISERNTTGSIDDEQDVLPALNRAQDRAASILAKYYADPLIRITSIQTVSGQSDYDIPEDAFEDRIAKLEVDISGRYAEMRRVRPADFGAFEVPAQASIPIAYGVYGRLIRILPNTSGAYNLRLMYCFDPPTLAVSQGRITIVNNAGNYVRLSSVTGDLSTDVDSDESYVSLVDGQTGHVKGTLQVQSVGNTTTNVQVTFRAVPTKTVHLGVPVTGSLTALAVNPDDYLCLAPNTCISTLRKPVSNFITNYAALILQEAALGGPGTDKLEGMLKEFEADVKALWAGQETRIRVKPVSSAWGGRRRSNYPYPSTTR